MARPAALLLLALLQAASAEVLTPRYFNLALGKRVTATATCGDEGHELYCKLVGANADHDEKVIQGQVCDICDASSETKKHPPEYAVDGMETWWQSPPLSRGMKYNEVNFTIDLGQVFHVAYVFLKMGNSPRPGLWILEKSTDYGKSYKPWQYFSDSPQDCERYFGRESLQPITRDDSVICSTEYSKIVPLEGGEIPISLLKYRPSANMYFNSSVLQEWTRATNVRLRFLRTKNLLGHLMSVARQDPTVTRRYFYSIKDISIGGRCMCNGHAETCEPSPTEAESRILLCQCQHNTCGAQCERCCPGFEQKKWRISQNWDRFGCEPCNCHNHSSDCVYDPEVDEKRLSLDISGRYEGGGVCQNCQHNTMGINCNQCQPTYYRPRGKRWDEIDVCQPCQCDLRFSTGNCEEETGRCECRKEFNAPNCDSCAYGYFDYPNCIPCVCNLNGTDGEHCTPIEGLCPCKYNYAGKSCEICQDGFYSPECKNCECNPTGSVSSVCDKESGNCTCKSKYSGRTCNLCEAGYYEYPTCKHCNCDTSGTVPNICDDVTGQCLCKTGFGGVRCDQCLSGYYMEVRDRERVCVPCNCSPTGSTSTSCSAGGMCNCLVNFGGKQCDQCSPGYYKFPECLACNCDIAGSLGYSCDDNGQCHCQPNFDGEKCDHCKESFYNYPACEECNRDPRGVIASFAGCGSVPAGQLCQCKERVQGRICNDCKPLFWNLQDYNPFGCEECNCNLTGTLGGLGACNTRTGQCTCKLHVGDRTCSQCDDGFYKLQSNNVFGCSECDCDIGGSIDNVCNKETGQCRCHSRVEGRRCDRPIRAHYFPTLHQFQYEVEEGLTPSGSVRYKSNDTDFPEFSWKGYVVFSPLQNEVINMVQISSKSSLYRMVLKYANKLAEPITATVTITPESVVDIQQTFSVYLRPTLQPQLITVIGEKDFTPSPLIMNPGNWNITIKTNKEIMIDYFVLIPEAYYAASVLTKVVDKPCVVGDEKLCREFAYPSLAGRPATNVKGLDTSIDAYIDDDQQLRELKAGPNDIPVINDAQNELQYNMQIEPNGRYILLVEYVTPINNRSINNEEQDSNLFASRGLVTVRFQSGDREINAILNLNDCPYASPCREVVIDDLAKIQIFDVQMAENVVHLEGLQNVNAGIKSIVAIPESDWHLAYITPKPYCLRRNGKCDPALFTAVVDSKKVEVESGTGGDRDTRPPILDNSTVVVYLSPDSEPIKIESKVPTPGEYMFVLHYYQPDHPEISVSGTLVVDGARHSGTVSVEHCPSRSGCRALLTLPDGNSRFLVNENFTLTFTGDKTKDLWLDYVLVIASTDFVDTALKKVNVLDYTQEFVGKCASNHYYVDPNVTGFCRDAVFSITAEYNSGTLRCFCDVEGSTHLECNIFGGQCHCKPNVIGRTCSACKTGYYGFPNCRPCKCPTTALCDDYGECICPKNVVGEQCNECKEYTFNYDELRGCDDCNCNPRGVVSSLQCDKKSGNCDCKDNVIGRMCDHCVPGHYSFPECHQCSCDLQGTTEDVCDQETAQCYCKKNVFGQACNMCKEDYFNLQADNPDGCTKCYCFGKTSRCTSSYYFWAEINGMADWHLANADLSQQLSLTPHETSPSSLNETVIGAEIGDTDNQHKIVYFGAPDYYLGKRLTSYGGYLKYSIFYTTRLNSQPVYAPDVILGGSNGFLVHNSIEQPPALTNWQHSIRISEDEFTNLDGTGVTRDQFMNVLLNVTSIYIRATYEADAVTTRLMGVTLDVAVDDYSEDIALLATSVEHCQCPNAYRGLSCEQCAEGYYRLSSGPHAGFCVPCQCNGHSRTCDVNTGICLECTDNTMGDHCEQCISGYHGDATGGTPRDCLICACPLPYPTNNFAVGCDLSENGSLISCQCKPGYGGARCEFCAAGYYGEPEILGDYCKPCNCSGNINPDDPASCDSHSGDCLKCVNNTYGAACNLCAPGFFGDAIFSKNCTACICDEDGMERCDPTTGTCVCRPGVVGEKCDRCAPDHWGLGSGRGCAPCDCGLAANSTQCDDNTGQCRCAKGVTGRHCDQCAAGYWNYTKEGCDHCNCNTGYSLGFMCNATGQCECLPGVIGEKCDRCPDRWVLIPNEGCLACDSCTDALIFSVEDMSELLANETQDFKDKADSFFTTQRLNYISNQTEILRPRIGELKNIDITEVTSVVNNLDSVARNLFRSAEFAATDSDKQIGRAAELAAVANQVLQSVREQSSTSKDVVAHVAELATSLELSQLPKVDNALSEAEQIKNDIAAKDLTKNEQQAFESYANVTAQTERMNIFVQPVNDQVKKFETLLNETRSLKSKMNEMMEYVNLAQRKTKGAEKLNALNKGSKFENKVTQVTRLNNAALMDLINTGFDITNSTTFIVQANVAVKNGSDALNSITQTNNEVKNRLTSLSEALPEMMNLKNEAQDHATSLRNKADNIRELAKRASSNDRTQHAYSAASAYTSIVKEIGDAKKAADEATEAVANSTEKNIQLKTRVTPALEKSNYLSLQAQQSHDTVENTLRPDLTKAEGDLEDARKLLEAADNENNAINISLPLIGPLSLQEEVEKANQAKNIATRTNATMSEFSGDLQNSRDRAETVPKMKDELDKKLAGIEGRVRQINEMNPNVTLTSLALNVRQLDFENRRREADQELNNLRDLIEQARTVANRISVGVQFDLRSTLQPRLPDTIDEMSTSTHVSAYFRTKKKDGLILYLGNPEGTMLRRTKSDDFMVIGVQNGYAYLTMDIGDSASGWEPTKIVCDKYVADDKWYQVIVDRVGRNVHLTIRESLENDTIQVHEKETILPGQHTIFNLDKQKSKLYVGGAPSDAKLQGISYPAFEGQIEELMIGDTPVGLWNFASAENLKAARERDKMNKPATEPKKYRFNGRAHVTMSAREYVQPDMNQVLLYFRTYAPDGLIYLVGEGSKFFSIQMQEGRVYVQIAFGDPENNLLIIGTLKTYNDGEWHQLDVTRYKTKCSLKIDDETYTGNLESPTYEIPDIDKMNFGGNNKGIIQITNKGFDGCIRDPIRIGNKIINLSIEVSKSTGVTESIGVSYGCQFASLVSLPGDDSYLRYSATSTDQGLQLTLKFKTSKPDGLIFVYASRMQTTAMPDSVSLSLNKGKLVLTSQREQVDTGINTYNDSQWHVVTVTHNAQKLKLGVDDYDYFSAENPPDPLNILDGVLFLGGIQPGYVIGGVSSRTPFQGCIADAALNGRVLNLLRPYSNTSVTFGRCGSITSTGGILPDSGITWKPPGILPTVPPEVNVEQPTNEVIPTAPPPTYTVPTIPTSDAIPTTLRPTPQTENGCALSYDPQYVIGDPKEGYRFGTKIDSHIEYAKLPGRQLDGFDLTITFRTFDENGGLMFYAASDTQPNQFLAVYMKNALLHFDFNCGDNTGQIISEQTYNDTEWHTVTIVRKEGHGKMTIDSDYFKEISVVCKSPSVLAPPFYYGGIKHRNISQIDVPPQPFKGCLKGLMMNGQYVTDIQSRVNSLRCINEVEDGIYFGPSTYPMSNYLKIKENFKVGLEFSISMEVKPRNSTGLLFNVQGKKDYMTLELLENEVVATVDNGRGPFQAIFQLGDKFSLCDGNWHKIHAVKSRHVVSVGVDGRFSDAGVGKSPSTDTRSYIFIGGHEKNLSKVKGAKAKRGFTGCIRNIRISGDRGGTNNVDIPLTAAHKNTHVGVCPTY